MRIEELFQGIPEQRLIQGDRTEEIQSIVYDSRQVNTGSVFVCLRGQRTDGHRYINDAYRAGCRCIVVEEGVYQPDLVANLDLTVIQLKDTRIGLAQMSANYYGHPADSLSIIGITGTKGKTTVAHMIAAILRKAVRKVGLIGTNGVTYGNQEYPTRNTTPESHELHHIFANMRDAGCEYVVMEISSQSVKMNRIYGIQFSIGIFTNLSEDHIGGDEHKDMQEYITCKAKMFSQCHCGVFNMDDSQMDKMRQFLKGEAYTFGTKGKPMLLASRISYQSRGKLRGMECSIRYGNFPEVISFIGTPGLFSVSNALAAWYTAKLLHISDVTIQSALFDFQVCGRMELVYGNEDTSIWIDYAHNAISMEETLRTMREYHPRRLISLFGCGGNRSRLRRFEMGEVSGRMADYSILTEDNSRGETIDSILKDICKGMNRTTGEYEIIPDRKEAIQKAILMLKPGDMLLLLGKGHEKMIEKKGRFFPFDEREVVNAQIKECEWLCQS